jgi:hypothetical protein
MTGDLNLNASKSAAADALAGAGFREVVPTARVATTPARHLLEPGRHIDSAFVRGAMATDQGRVHGQVKGSDHYPISFKLFLHNWEKSCFPHPYLTPQWLSRGRDGIVYLTPEVLRGGTMAIAAGESQLRTGRPLRSRWKVERLFHLAEELTLYL